MITPLLVVSIAVVICCEEVVLDEGAVDVAIVTGTGEVVTVKSGVADVGA